MFLDYDLRQASVNSSCQKKLPGSSRKVVFFTSCYYNKQYYKKSNFCTFWTYIMLIIIRSILLRQVFSAHIPNLYIKQLVQPREIATKTGIARSSARSPTSIHPPIQKNCSTAPPPSPSAFLACDNQLLSIFAKNYYQKLLLKLLILLLKKSFNGLAVHLHDYYTYDNTGPWTKYKKLLAYVATYMTSPNSSSYVIYVSGHWKILGLCKKISC